MNDVCVAAGALVVKHGRSSTRKEFASLRIRQFELNRKLLYGIPETMLLSVASELEQRKH